MHKSIEWPLSIQEHQDVGLAPKFHYIPWISRYYLILIGETSYPNKLQKYLCWPGSSTKDVEQISCHLNKIIRMGSLLNITVQQRLS